MADDHRGIYHENFTPFSNIGTDASTGTGAQDTCPWSVVFYGESSFLSKCLILYIMEFLLFSWIDRSDNNKGLIFTCWDAVNMGIYKSCING